MPHNESIKAICHIKRSIRSQQYVILPFAHKLAKTGIFQILRCMCSGKMTAASPPKAIASAEQHSEAHKIGAAHYSGSAVLYRLDVGFHPSTQATNLGKST
jgi:hypothetical protein